MADGITAATGASERAGTTALKLADPAVQLALLRACPDGGTGRHTCLAGARSKEHAGSNPAPGTASTRHIDSAVPQAIEFGAPAKRVFGLGRSKRHRERGALSFPGLAWLLATSWGRGLVAWLTRHSLGRRSRPFNRASPHAGPRVVAGTLCPAHRDRETGDQLRLWLRCGGREPTGTRRGDSRPSPR